MRRSFRLICLLCIAAVLLSGCMMRTVDEMYCLPRRSEAFNSLQSAINSVMADMEYCAPISGENQQTVQMADLDGDGMQEYLLFAKDSEERVMRLLIFANRNGTFIHAFTVECSGVSFDRVEYADLDDRGGVEIVVGQMLSDQSLRTVSVYSMINDSIEHLATSSYTHFLTFDMDADGLHELFILRPGLTENDAGVAQVYSFSDGRVTRSGEADLSRSVDDLKRVLTGQLHGGQAAVYVASTVENTALITDVYALLDGQLCNVTLSGETGTSIQTMRDYYVYANDIDFDGVIELPDLISMKRLHWQQVADQHSLIRWYALSPDGTEMDKLFTYHNFIGGWYMVLESGLVSGLSVSVHEGAYTFYLSDDQNNAQVLLTVYVLTGQDREGQSQLTGRFVIYKSDTTVYAASLGEMAQTYKITEESVIRNFHLIQEEWKTGET